MGKDFKYRVVEHNGKFKIEVYAYEERGFLWWKRKEPIGWRDTNSQGGVHQWWPVTQAYSKTFKSLKKAKKQIAEWQSETVYHEI